MQPIGNLIQILLDHQIEFVIVGGMAAVLHGSSQVTQDLDVCAPLDVPHIEKLRECLAPFHPTHRMTPKKLSFLEFPEDISNIKNLYLQTDKGIIDVLGQISGVGDYSRVARLAVQVGVFGAKCQVISIDDLILAKQFMARPKDLATIKELKVVRGNSEVP